MPPLDLPAAVRALPPGPRALAGTLAEAVDAAYAHDGDRFDRAALRLAATDPEQLRRLLGAVLRALLEDVHPDGVTGDDLRAVVAEGTRRIPAWGQPVDPQLLVVVVAGAFGVHPQDDERPEAPGPQVARHACLLLADLLAASGRAFGPYLVSAFAEIARSEREDDL